MKKTVNIMDPVSSKEKTVVVSNSAFSAVDVLEISTKGYIASLHD